MKDEIKDILDTVENNSKKIEEIVDGFIKKHCDKLDELVSEFKNILQNEVNPPTDEELDDMCLKLPTYLYFVGEVQEVFGIREDTSKSVKTKLYNQFFKEARGTINDKQAFAESHIVYEEIVHKAYTRAYKAIKQKVEAAYEILSSVKKVMSRRMGEFGLSMADAYKTKSNR